MYVNQFVGTFCYKDGTEVVISISKYFEVEPPLVVIPKQISFAGTSDQPVTLNYTDTDYKLERINGTELTVKVKSDENFELADIYTENEKQWLITVTGAIQFTGFLLPDSGTEPYESKPYNVTLRFTDALATLKDVPFLDYAGNRITGYHNDLFYLRQVFQKTKIDIDLGIAVNTLANGMNPTICPLEQIYIDAARFYDNGGLPYSCWDVLDSILIRHSARLHQFGNKWQIINVLQLCEAESIKMWNYGYLAGSKPSTMIGNTITAGGQDKPLHPSPATHSTAKAFASSTAYYQYGYPSNELLNGNFNDWTAPAIYPNHWIPVGTATGSTGTRAGTTDDRFLIVQATPIFTDRIQNDTPVQVRQGETVQVSFTAGVSDYDSVYLQQADGGNRKTFIEVAIVASDGYSYVQTATGDAWVDHYGVYNILKYSREYAQPMDINFTLPARDKDYTVTVGFRVINVMDDPIRQLYVDNVELKPSASSRDIQAPIGEYMVLTSLTEQSYTGEPLRLLHSNDTNIKRTSVISIGSPPPILPSNLWQRAGHSGEAITLLEMVADTELTLHAKPYRIFEGTFKGLGWIDINTILTIERMPGKYLFLSGTFDLKEGNHRLKFAEIMTDPVPRKVEYSQDFGALRDKKGVSVGAPNGINVTGGTYQTNVGDLIVPVKATTAEVTAGTNDANFVTPLTLAQRLTSWWSSKASVIQTLTARWVFKAGIKVEDPTTNTQTVDIYNASGGGWIFFKNTFNASFHQLVFLQGNNAADREVGRFDAAGRLQVSQLKLAAHNTAPASATATGVLGEVRFDANYIYYCTATNVWKRAPLSTW